MAIFDNLWLTWKMKQTSIMPFVLSGKRVFVAGHRGLVGSALVRRLEAERCEILFETRSKLDLTDSLSVENWMKQNRPHAIFIAAAKVGGILANELFPAEYIFQNLKIELNLLHSAYLCGTEKVVFLGSSCIYPKYARQPIVESALLSGSLEPTNEPYAIAKIAGIKLCQAYRRQYGCDFVSAMPSNLYGPGDNFDLTTSHVIPALIRKMHEAKVSGAEEVVIWGSGTPRREFLHVDDCADALVHIMANYSEDEHINVGSGQDCAISELAEIVSKVVGFSGKIVMDSTKPDGTPRKLMCSSKLGRIGWRARIPLDVGISWTYDWFVQNLRGAR